MGLETIGRNIRKFRIEKKLRQEDLAERAGLSEKYIGMVERGEKTPSLETFIHIINALEISADMVLTDVVSTGYAVKASLLTEKLERLPAEERARVYDVIDVLLHHAKSTPTNE